MLNEVDDTRTKYAKKCKECSKVFNEGYCIESGLEYYCSDDCLHKHISDKQFKDLYDEGKGDSYWTTWRCDEDMLYYKDGSEIADKEGESK